MSKKMATETVINARDIAKILMMKAMQANGPGRSCTLTLRRELAALRIDISDQQFREALAEAVRLHGVVIEKSAENKRELTFVSMSLPGLNNSVEASIRDFIRTLRSQSPGRKTLATGSIAEVKAAKARRAA